MRELVDKKLMLEDAKSWVAMDSYEQHWINNMSAWIENLPTVGASDEDCISRQTAIDAVKQYISQFDAIDVNFLDGLKEAINIVMKLPSAHPTHTTHSNTLDALDCISRQAAIELIERMKPYHQDADDIAEMIANMPSAQPEQHFCRECKYVRYYGNVDKYGNCESFWYCMNWDGGTDEEGFCYEWEKREDGRLYQQTGGD